MESMAWFVLLTAVMVWKYDGEVLMVFFRDGYGVVSRSLGQGVYHLEEEYVLWMCVTYGQ